MVVPFLAQDFKTGPTIMGGEINGEELTEFAIEISHTALWASEYGDGEIGERGQVLKQAAQGNGFTGAGVAGDEGKATMTSQGFHTLTEVTDRGRDPEGLGRDFGGKRIPFQAKTSL